MATIGTLDIRITFDSQNVPLWRVRLLGRIARALGVPVSVDRADAPDPARER